MMLLNFYGFNLTKDEIERSIHRTPEGHIYMVNVARFFGSLGLSVDCFSYNLCYTGPQNAKLARSQFIRVLEKEHSTITDIWLKERLEATIEALKEGVNYVFQKPTRETMTSYLEKGIPLLVAVNPCALRNEQGDIYRGHDIILTGVESNIVYYIDPLKGRECKISFEDLMFVILARKIIETSAYMVGVKIV